MRSLDYDIWKKQRSARRQAELDVDNSVQGRVPARRPRDPEKQAVLARLDQARRDRYIASGKLAKLGPRHWKWHIDFRQP